MAPGAKIAFFDVGSVLADYLDINDLPGIFETAYVAGARVHSNSWGSDDYGAYAQLSYEADAYMYYNDDMLIVVAAGNEGSTGFNTLGSPATGKNVLTVGASMPRLEQFDTVNPELTVAYFSALGPTDDGRIGIDLIAPGHYVMSALAGNLTALENSVRTGHGKVQFGVTKMSGTSMATPVVAGAALLVRQYLMDPNFWAAACLSGTYHRIL